LCAVAGCIAMTTKLSASSVDNKAIAIFIVRISGSRADRSVSHSPSLAQHF
jgi:hypothetical protein